VHYFLKKFVFFTPHNLSACLRRFFGPGNAVHFQGRKTVPEQWRGNVQTEGLRVAERPSQPER
jgi:hypothetical protein